MNMTAHLYSKLKPLQNEKYIPHLYWTLKNEKCRLYQICFRISQLSSLGRLCAVNSAHSWKRQWNNGGGSSGGGDDNDDDDNDKVVSGKQYT